jgi:two-component system, NarL family, sensor histidine kinase UhpB
MRAKRLWYDRTVRTQLLLAVGLINLIAGIVAALLSILNTRSSTQIEIESSLEIAQRFVGSTIKDLQSRGQLDKIAELLPAELKHLRHVRIFMMDPAGQIIVLSSRTAAHENQPPEWFTYLVRSNSVGRRVRVVSPDHVNPLVIVGEPSDEIAEHWDDFRSLALLWIAFQFVILVTLYLVLGRILNPLHNLTSGMIRLEDGDYATRLKLPKVKELAVLTHRFNTLAGALDIARSENSLLHHQLISLQETERKEIAHELHDEAGPCLFGITANASSITHIANRNQSRVHSEIALRAGEILKIAERLKRMNRSLLRELAPVSRGHVCLAELVEELASNFERQHPGTTVATELGVLAKTYGKGIDLTLYRAIQEGITNAVRHGKASRVSIHLAEQHEPGQHSDQRHRSSLALRLADNGSGMKNAASRGFGLTTMIERVRSLEGKCEIVSTPDEGTSLTIRIPTPAMVDDYESTGHTA